MWLLSAAVRQAIQQAYANGVLPTLEQQADYEARYGFSEGDGSRLLSIAGDVAELRIAGVITKAPSLVAMLFGGGNTTYSEITAALAEAAQNPDVKRLEMRVDSPGGHIDGLFDTVAALQSFDKPIRAVIENTAASAAYALVSQADEIVAANRAVRVGSVGVVVSMMVDDDVVDVTSTKAPKKRPDVRTEEGQAVVREELDALHEIFVDAIASGRETSPDKVNAEYGQGATLLADEALKRGMIDSIQGAPSLRVVQSANDKTTASGGKQPETGPMNLNELKAQHPDVYAAAVAEITAKERDRVTAHLTMGQASGDMETAVKACTEGSEMTATLQAKYLAAGMNRKDQSNRQDDDAAAAAAAAAAAGGDEGADLGSNVVALVESLTGSTAE